MNFKWTILLFSIIPYCFAFGQAKRVTIKQSYLNTKSKTEYIQRDLTFVWEVPKLSMELSRVKEYNVVTYEETAANDTIKMPVTYEIDYDTDNPVADNELEEMILPSKMENIKRQVKYLIKNGGYQLVNSKNKQLYTSVYSSFPLLQADPIVNTIRFEDKSEQEWVDSTFTTQDNGGVYINRFKRQEMGDDGLNRFEIKGYFIGNPVDLASLLPSLERIRYTGNLGKEYTGFLVSTKDGFIIEIKLSVRTHGFYYTLHEGMKQMPFDFSFTSHITNEIR